MSINKFEEIVAWQKAKIITLETYTIFKDHKDFGFKDQIQRCATSMMNNIAEGFERKSDREFSRFLYIAKGSAGEYRSMLYLAKELKYLSQEDFDKLYVLSIEISKMLSGFIKKLNV